MFKFWGICRGPMTFTLVHECLAVGLSWPGFKRWTQAYMTYAHGGISMIKYLLLIEGMPITRAKLQSTKNHELSRFTVFFLCPSREFFTHLETSPLPVKGCKFWPMLGMLIVIVQWGFFTVPHLLWQRSNIYNGHLRGPVTPTTITERLAMELSLPVLTKIFMEYAGFEIDALLWTYQRTQIVR